MKDHKPLVVMIASGNAHKVEEIAAILGGQVTPDGRKLEVVSAARLPPHEPIEEPGATFAANAAIKARAYAALASTLAASARPDFVVADDSGLCVDALDGRPGVHSARYAAADATDAQNRALLLRELHGVAPARRGAAFVCSVAGCRISERTTTTPTDIGVCCTSEGRCEGTILESEQGSGGFGYDPIFYYPPLGRSFAELSQSEKNSVSHRGRAFEALGRQLTSGAASPSTSGGVAG